MQLAGWVGRVQPSIMADRLQRSLSVVLQKLGAMGYDMQADVRQPLGLTATALANRLGIGIEHICGDIACGVLKAHREAKKDFSIAWADVARYEAHIKQLARARGRVMARIKEPTMSKQEAMRELGLSETHIQRYLAGRILKAWKVPCRYTQAARQRWEWRVSVASVADIKAKRESGRLRLRKRAYRQLQDATNALVKQLRRQKRLGQRDDLKHPRSALKPGCFTISQIASHVGLSAAQVYEHVQLGRLVAESVRVGTRSFWVVHPDALPTYVAWTQREVVATGPVKAWRTMLDKVHRAGRMSLAEAAAQYGVKRESLAAAAQTGQLKTRRIGKLRTVDAVSMQAYLAKKAMQQRNTRQ
jgi:hypothetical protein